MRLLKLAENVQQMVVDGEISTGHARALLAIEDENEQYRIALKVYNEKMSVRDVEKLIKNLGKPKKDSNGDSKINESVLLAYQKLEEELKVALGTKVSIVAKDTEKGNGKLEIEFYSVDDLERISDIMKGNKE